MWRDGVMQDMNVQSGCTVSQIRNRRDRQKETGNCTEMWRVIVNIRQSLYCQYDTRSPPHVVGGGYIIILSVCLC